MSDLDQEELIATRKLHGLNDKLYMERSDINVGSIEQNIKILYKLVTTKFNNDYSIDNVDKEAIENLLLDYTRQKQINEEHQKINGELREKVKELEDKYILEKVAKEEAKELLEDSIPKQKIKKLMKERLINLCGIDFVSIQQLEFLLQESEDK